MTIRHIIIPWTHSCGHTHRAPMGSGPQTHGSWALTCIQHMTSFTLFPKPYGIKRIIHQALYTSTTHYFSNAGSSSNVKYLQQELIEQATTCTIMKSCAIRTTVDILKESNAVRYCSKKKGHNIVKLGIKVAIRKWKMLLSFKKMWKKIILQNKEEAKTKTK